jgi:hypothetical protein
VWDINFRPLLPPHAQQTARGNAGQQQQIMGGQPSAISSSPSAATGASSSVHTPSSTVIKMEPNEVAEAETMDVDLPDVHPSAAITSRSPTSAAASNKLLEDTLTSTESIISLPLITENGDLPLDLVKVMFRDIDASQCRGDGEVRLFKIILNIFTTVYYILILTLFIDII